MLSSSNSSAFKDRRLINVKSSLFPVPVVPIRVGNTCPCFWCICVIAKDQALVSLLQHVPLRAPRRM
uniref:Uncharacterized protein n=1 Tax=Anopheles albimanus TaxID=7167 RepID=A0A182FYL8_ANOAL